MPFGSAFGAAMTPGGRGVAAGMGGAAAMRKQRNPLMGQNIGQGVGQAAAGMIGGKPMSQTMANRFATTGPRFTQPGMRGLAPSGGAMGAMMGQNRMPQYAPQVPQMPQEDYSPQVQDVRNTGAPDVMNAGRQMFGPPPQQGYMGGMGGFNPYMGGMGGGIGPQPDFMQNMMNRRAQQLPPRAYDIANQFTPQMPPINRYMPQEGNRVPGMFQQGGWRGMRDRYNQFAQATPEERNIYNQFAQPAPEETQSDYLY
jgi:hypothetical protein